MSEITSTPDGAGAPIEEEKPTLADRERGFFGHPWGLANLSAIEMWERFSFYGMQALVAYYIYYSVADGGLGYSESAATSIVGAYGGLVYLSAIFGGWISDRLFGAERSLTGAAVLIMLGHISLSLIPGMTGVGIGLIAIALGSGTLKATTSVVVGVMYRRSDMRRDAAFSIYYMGVNIGGLIGPLATNALWEGTNFHWGFALAAFGMAAGLIQYLALRGKTLSSIPKGALNPATPKHISIVGGAAAIVVVIIVISALAGWLTFDNLASVVTVVTIVAAILLFGVILSSKQITAVERSRVIAFIPMFLASCGFWALFQQQFTSIAVLADQALDRNVFGWDFPPGWVQSINPLFIIIFAGVFSAMWLKLGDRQIATPYKFALSNVVMGIAFLVFIPFTDGMIPMLVMVVVLFLFTMAELLLSPLGQSLATKLAPAAFNSQMVALFFLSVAIGSSASGWLAGFYNPDDQAATNQYFMWIGIASIVLGIVIALVANPVVRLMKGVR
ncbi:peptide MFS transporter [Dietzia sp.]|uniref:peptide MFS transporter n=1 Tax=Dietzia sp. TaxID=1871616 RepID=UPI002FDA8B96